MSLTGINNLWAAHLLNRFIQSSSCALGNFIFCSSKSNWSLKIAFHLVSVSLNLCSNLSSENITKCVGVFVKIKTDLITFKDSLNLESQTTKDITILSIFVLFLTTLDLKQNTETLFTFLNLSRSNKKIFTTYFRSLFTFLCCVEFNLLPFVILLEE